jgi:hypothetical protein
MKVRSFLRVGQYESQDVFLAAIQAAARDLPTGPEIWVTRGRDNRHAEIAIQWPGHAPASAVLPLAAPASLVGETTRWLVRSVAWRVERSLHAATARNWSRRSVGAEARL